MAEVRRQVIDEFTGQLRKTSKALADPSKGEGLKMAKKRVKAGISSRISGVLKRLFNMGDTK